MDSSNYRSEVTLNVRETIDDRGTAPDQSRKQVSTGPSDGDQVLKFWGFKWIPQVRPRYMLGVLGLTALLVLAGGWVAVISAAKTACENQTNQAYLDLRVVTDDLQEQHSRHRLAVASLAAYAQQQPNLTELVGPKLDQLVADSLEQDRMMTNLWLAPGGVVASIFPLPGYEDFLGLDLFQDPVTAQQALIAVESGEQVMQGPIKLPGGGQGLVILHPVFIPGPVENRTEAFGFPDASVCEACYADPDRVFWGFAGVLKDLEMWLTHGTRLAEETEGSWFSLLRVGTDGEQQVVFTSGDGEPLREGDKTTMAWIPNTNMGLMVESPTVCNSWVPWGGIACTVLVVVAFLLGLKSLHLFVQNSALQHSELVQLRHLAEQRRRDKISDGSEAIHRMVVAFITVAFKKRWVKQAAQEEQESQKAMELERKPSQRRRRLSVSQSMSMTSIKELLANPAKVEKQQDQESSSGSINIRSDRGHKTGRTVSVILQIPLLAEMEGADADAVRRMRMLLRELCWEVLEKCGSSSMEEDRSGGAQIAYFENCNSALCFALAARRALMWGPWPEDVLLLPGCHPCALAHPFQKQASGPRVRIFIELDSRMAALSDADVSRTFLKHMQPWQIILTSDVWAQVTRLQDAGLPYVRDLGRFSVQKDQDLVISVLELHEPRWDMRLPQLPLPRKLRMTRVMGPGLNLCPIPTHYKTRQLINKEPSLPAVLLQVDKSSSNLTLEMIERLEDSARSMALLFRGHIAPAPCKWTPEAPIAVFFPNTNAAVAFSVCFQMALAHAQSPVKDESQLIGRIGGVAAGHGPGVKCAVVAAPRAVVDALVKSTDTSTLRSFATSARITFRNIRKNSPEWSAWNLMDLAFPGQILVCGSLVEEVSLTMPSSSHSHMIEVIHMGRHILHSFGTSDETDETGIDICEARILDLGPRDFPPLQSKQRLVAGYLSSPDASGNIAFVQCQAVAPQSLDVTSTPEYIDAVRLWKELCRSMLPAHGGYDCGDRSLGISLVFRTLEGAVAFAVTMQKKTMRLAYPQELLTKDGFKPEYSNGGEMLVCGLTIKVGISYGTPVIRQPDQTTGRAVYRGPCVTRSCQIVTAASPGQVLVDGEPLRPLLELPGDSEQKGKQWSSTIDVEKLNFPGCSQLYVVQLGQYQLEKERTAVSLVSLALPELSERKHQPVQAEVQDPSAPAPPRRSTNSSTTDREGPGKDLSGLIKDILEHKQTSSENHQPKVRVLGVLGQGSQGRVLLARWKGVKVAYKIIAIPDGDNQRQKAQAHAVMELAISATMSHPNIVQTYSYQLVQVRAVHEDNDSSAESAMIISPGDQTNARTSIDEDEARLWEARMIQELCTGKTLRENLDRKKFSPEGERLPHVEIAMRLVIDVASGMSHIHSHNIVHGDLKAGNVLLCPSERSGPDRNPSTTKLPSMTAKVADFGLSTKLSEGSTHLSNCYSGTITHMAPEVMLAGQVSKGADVYAFGILLYEVFTGRRAFEGLTQIQVTHAVATNNRRPTFDTEVPRLIVQLACDCWGPAASRPTIDAVLQRLVSLQRIVKYTPAHPLPISSVRKSGTSDSDVAPSAADAAEGIKRRMTSPNWTPQQEDSEDTTTPAPAGQEEDTDDEVIDIKKLQMQGAASQNAMVQSRSMDELPTLHKIQVAEPEANSVPNASANKGAEEEEPLKASSSRSGASRSSPSSPSRDFYQVLKQRRAAKLAASSSCEDLAVAVSEDNGKDEASASMTSPSRKITWGEAHVLPPGADASAANRRLFGASSTATPPAELAPLIEDGKGDPETNKTLKKAPSKQRLIHLGNSAGEFNLHPKPSSPLGLVLDSSDDEDSSSEEEEQTTFG